MLLLLLCGELAAQAPIDFNAIRNIPLNGHVLPDFGGPWVLPGVFPNAVEATEFEFAGDDGRLNLGALLSWDYAGISALPNARLDRPSVLLQQPEFACADHEVVRAQIELRLDMGEDYTLGQGPFNCGVEVQIEPHDILGLNVAFPLDAIRRRLEISSDAPEQVVSFDLIDYESRFANVDHYRVSVLSQDGMGGGNSDLDLAVRNHLRLEAYIVNAVTMDAEGHAVTPAPIELRHGGKRVRFRWDNACARFPMHEFQLLKLHNINPAKDGIQQIDAEIDWRQALTIPVANYRNELELPVVEGSGFYVWRVRPVGDAWPGGIADFRNHGDWPPNHPDGAVSYAQPLGGNAMVFYYEQFDKDKNWAYARSFGAADSWMERLTFKDRLGRDVQMQSAGHTDDAIVVEQHATDYAGRKALRSLPVAYRDSALGHVSDMLLNGAGAPYGPAEFDQDGRVFAPQRASGGASAYYGFGDTPMNADANIPSADSFPFFRTLFAADGVNAPKQESGPGEVFRMKPFAGTRNRMAYTGMADEKELLRVFGEDAPVQGKIYKQVSIDANKVAHVSYFNGKGMKLASCLMKSVATTNLVDEPGEHALGDAYLLADGAQARPFASQMVFGAGTGDTRSGSLELEIEGPRTVTLAYSLLRNAFEVSCADLCMTCDYHVRVQLSGTSKDLNPVDFGNGPVKTLLDTTLDGSLLRDAACTAEMLLLLSDVQILLPEAGTYRVSVSADAADVPGGAADEYADALRDTIGDRLDSLLRADLIPQNGQDESVHDFLYLANDGQGDLDGLYAFLDAAAPGNPGVEPVVEEGEITAYDLHADACHRLRIPRLECIDPCAPGSDYTPEQHVFNRLDQVRDEFGVAFWHNYSIASVFKGYLPGKFNDMVDTLRNDLGCGEIWTCLDQTIDQFISNRTQLLNGQPDLTDYLSVMIECLGFNQWEGISTVQFDPVGGYLSHPHKYFYIPDILVLPGAQQPPQANNGDFQQVNGVWVLGGPMVNDPQYMTITVPNLDHPVFQGEPRWDSALPEGEITLMDELLQIHDPAWDAVTWNIKWGIVNNPAHKGRRWQAFRRYVRRPADVPPPVGNLQELLDIRETMKTGCRDMLDARRAAFRDAFRAAFAPREQADCKYNAFIAALEAACEDLSFIDAAGQPLPENGLVLAQIAGIGTGPQIAMYQNIAGKAIRLHPQGHTACDMDFPAGAPIPGALPEHPAMELLEADLARVIAQVNASRLAQPWDLQQLLLEEGWAGLLQCVPLVMIDRDFSYELRLESGGSGCKLWLDKTDLSYAGNQPVSILLCDEFCYTPAPQVCDGFCVEWISVLDGEEPDGEVIYDCIAHNLLFVIQTLNQQANEILADAEAEFRADYETQCRMQIEQDFSAGYDETYYHYTLYYYDRAGRLLKTVTPEGVDIVGMDYDAAAPRQTLAGLPQHTHETEYAYNSLGHVLRASTPDGGTIRRIYDDLGHLRFSQDARQAAEGSYAYIKYDALFRPVETGKALTADFPGLEVHVLQANFPDVGVLSEQTFTHYSIPGEVMYVDREGRRKPQRFLQNRVSFTETDDHRTYYSYDPHGNVEWMVHDIPGLGEKSIGYEYDLVTGNVLKVHYNESGSDAFFHRYSWDADGRLLQAETSTNDVIWEREMGLEYYPHGPVKRKTIGEDKLQGVDYVYTLQGMLKALNHSSLSAQADPGHDGDLAQSRYARDAFGMELHRFAGDFRRQGSVFAAGNAYTPAFDDRFNNGIGAWTSSNVLTGQLVEPVRYAGTPTAYTYAYDELYRLTSAQFTAHDSIHAGMVPIQEYGTAYGHNANGDLLRLRREAFSQGANADMDDLTLHLTPGTARLTHVDDAVPAGNFDDIRQQALGNYSYDASGQLTADAESGIASIEWTVTGKVARVLRTDNSEVRFTYDADDYRLTKTANGQTEYYIRDADGQVVAIYRHSQENLWTIPPSFRDVYTLEEVPIMAGERIGVYKPSRPVSARILNPVNVCDQLRRRIRFPQLLPTYEQRYTRRLGKRTYELRDHLDNARVTFADVKLSTIDSVGLAGNFKVDIRSIQNYYPYGMQMPGRSYAPNAYRHGFNGMEKDDEVRNLTGTSYDFNARFYAPRIGRWLSRDPLEASLVGWSPYQYGLGNPVSFMDPDGQAEANKDSHMSTWAIYTIRINGEIYKHGVANMARQTRRTSLPDRLKGKVVGPGDKTPKRLHDQLRSLARRVPEGDQITVVFIVTPEMSKGDLKKMEDAKIKATAQKTGSIPPGNTDHNRKADEWGVKKTPRSANYELRAKDARRARRGRGGGGRLTRSIPVVGAIVELATAPPGANMKEVGLRAIAGEIGIGPVDLASVYDAAVSIRTYYENKEAPDDFADAMYDYYTCKCSSEHKAAIYEKYKREIDIIDRARFLRENMNDRNNGLPYIPKHQDGRIKSHRTMNGWQ